MAASSVTERDEVLLARIASGAGEFIEDGENFEFYFHFLGDRFDEQIGFAAYVFDGA